MKIDMHLHTWYSRDGISPVEKIIKTVRKKRKEGSLDGIAVTDHDTTKAWADFKKAGFPVVYGQEVTSTMGDMLALFIQEEIKSRKPEEVIDEVQDQDGLVVLPHPFDVNRKSYFKKAVEFAKKVDGFEVFNSRMRTPNGNKKAFDFAKKNKIPMTGGGDSHIRFEIGNAFTQAEANDIDEFRKELENCRTTAHGKHSKWIAVPVTKLSKLGLMGRAP